MSIDNVLLGFHGAARTVTGSRYLLHACGQRTGIDAGIFQGYRSLRRLNWREPPYPAHTVDRILLTHAHIDHIGFLPRLVRNGFKGPILCTDASAELVRLLLMDSAKIQEEDARHANKYRYSKHSPALPLYSSQDAKATLKQLEVIDPNGWVDVGPRLRARWTGAGHILGSCSIEIEITANRGNTGTIVFSGDIGRYDMPLHPDPQPRPESQVLVCESTYGGRNHDLDVSVDDQMATAISRCLERRGTVLIPAFAVGRSQQLTFILRRLMLEGRIPQARVHIDSPMAVNATGIYGRHMDEHHLDADVFEDGRQVLFPDDVELHKTAKHSKELNRMRGPRIIISASGMLTAGRVLHHLKRLVGDRKNLVVLAGYQAPGTRGRAILEGQRTVRIHGQDLAVRAECVSLHGLSAHAGQSELMRWAASCETKPRQTFLTHGEPEAAWALAHKMERELGWNVDLPELDQTLDITDALGLG